MCLISPSCTYLAGLCLIEEVVQYRKEQEGLEVMTVSNIEYNSS